MLPESFLSFVRDTLSPAIDSLLGQLDTHQQLNTIEIKDAKGRVLRTIPRSDVALFIKGFYPFTDEAGFQNVFRTIDLSDKQFLLALKGQLSKLEPPLHKEKLESEPLSVVKAKCEQIAKSVDGINDRASAEQETWKAVWKRQLDEYNAYIHGLPSTIGQKIFEEYSTVGQLKPTDVLTATDVDHITQAVNTAFATKDLSQSTPEEIEQFIKSTVEANLTARYQDKYHNQLENASSAEGRQIIEQHIRTTVGHFSTTPFIQETSAQLGAIVEEKNSTENRVNHIALERRDRSFQTALLFLHLPQEYIQNDVFIANLAEQLTQDTIFKRSNADQIVYGHLLTACLKSNITIDKAVVDKIEGIVKTVAPKITVYAEKIRYQTASSPNPKKDEVRNTVEEFLRTRYPQMASDRLVEELLAQFNDEEFLRRYRDTPSAQKSLLVKKIEEVVSSYIPTQQIQPQQTESVTQTLITQQPFINELTIEQRQRYITAAVSYELSKNVLVPTNEDVDKKRQEEARQVAQHVVYEFEKPLNHYLEIQNDITQNVEATLQHSRERPRFFFTQIAQTALGRITGVVLDAVGSFPEAQDRLLSLYLNSDPTAYQNLQTHFSRQLAFYQEKIDGLATLPETAQRMSALEGQVQKFTILSQSLATIQAQSHQIGRFNPLRGLFGLWTKLEGIQPGTSRVPPLTIFNWLGILPHRFSYFLEEINNQFSQTMRRLGSYQLGLTSLFQQPLGRLSSSLHQITGFSLLNTFTTFKNRLSGSALGRISRGFGSFFLSSRPYLSVFGIRINAFFSRSARTGLQGLATFLSSDAIGRFFSVGNRALSQFSFGGDKVLTSLIRGRALLVFFFIIFVPIILFFPILAQISTQSAFLPLNLGAEFPIGKVPANQPTPQMSTPQCPLRSTIQCGSINNDLGSGCKHCDGGYGPGPNSDACVNYPGTKFGIDINGAKLQELYLPDINGHEVIWVLQREEKSSNQATQVYIGTNQDTPEKYLLQYHHTQIGSGTLVNQKISSRTNPQPIGGRICANGCDHVHIQIGDGTIGANGVNWKDAALYFGQCKL